MAHTIAGGGASRIIRAFGFAFRYPEMQGLADTERLQDYKKDDPLNRHWYRVGFNAGRDYAGPDFVNQMAEILLKVDNNYPLASYEGPRNVEYGLELYSHPGIDEKTGTLWRLHEHAEDVYIHRNDRGNVDAIIRCSNRRIPAPPCVHRFGMAPAFNAGAYVTYPRYALKDWRAIQHAVEMLMFGFVDSRANAS